MVESSLQRFQARESMLEKVSDKRGKMFIDVKDGSSAGNRTLADSERNLISRATRKYLD